MPAARSSDAIAFTGSVAKRPAGAPSQYGFPAVLDADIVWDKEVHHVGGDPLNRDDGKSGSDAEADPDVGSQLVELGVGQRGELGGIDRHLNRGEFALDVIRAAKLGQDLERWIL